MQNPFACTLDGLPWLKVSILNFINNLATMVCDKYQNKLPLTISKFQDEK